MQLRIVSGIKRGMKLKSPEGLDTRPTMDNVKEAVFSMLYGMCPDSIVLDLFAGSGAMGIESLSRGALFADFNDISKVSCKICFENLSEACFENVSEVHNLDCFEFLKKARCMGKKYDLIFLDPPYKEHLLDKCLCEILKSKILSDKGLVICEFDFGTNIDICGYRLVKDKKYGRCCINILEAL